MSMTVLHISRLARTEADRQWFTATVEGAKGARYEVDMLLRRGWAKPWGYATQRLGRSRRSFRKGALRHALVLAAEAAIDMSGVRWDEAAKAA